MKRLSYLVLVLLAAGVVDSAAAHSGRHGHSGRTRAHIGVYFGPSIEWSGYYPGPYAYPYANSPYTSPYYYPYSAPVAPVVIVPALPQNYIEQSQPEEQPAQPSANDWYYCRKPEGYYPYVRECPGGWQRVPAQPQR